MQKGCQSNQQKSDVDSKHMRMQGNK